MDTSRRFCQARWHLLKAPEARILVQRSFRSALAVARHGFDALARFQRAVQTRTGQQRPGTVTPRVVQSM